MVYSSGGRVRAVSRLCAAAAIIGLSATSISAQIDPFALRNVPSGSPLGDQSTRGQGQSGLNGGDDQSSDPYFLAPRERTGPTQIDDTTSQNDPTADADGRTTDADGRATDDRGVRTRDANGRLSSRSQIEPGGVAAVRRPAPPNEFERFVEQRVGRRLPRFGAELIVPANRDFATPTNTTVPPGYILNPGDQVFIGLTGSIEGSVTRQIDANGRIFLPRVGTINLAGVSFGDLKTVVERAVGVRFRGFNVTVAVPRLRGIRVYVTGFANNPGAYSVNSLSTLVNAVLAAGGPSAGGSFRSVQLIRNGELVSDFDLYDFVRNGDKSKDVLLQNQDVLFVAPLGAQVALTGSVNGEAIYEAKPGESLQDLIRYAGGVNALADPSRVVLYRLANANTVGAVQVAREALASAPVSAGDIIQVLSEGSLARPLERQTVLVRIDGEVSKPGNYVVAPGTSLAQAIQLAGGLTSRAFVFGSNFQRVSVRRQQRESFDEAVRQLEVTLAGSALNADSSIDPVTRAAQVASAQAVLDRLRRAEPDGRVVLPLNDLAAPLPGTLTLENNDTLFVPPRPSTVGVFGAVYRPASFLIADARPLRLRDYLKMAGGTLRVADTRDTFVVRANGAVISRRNGGLNARVLPGDVIFVPVKTQSSSLLAKIAQIGSIIAQFSIGAIALDAVTN
ncbi:MAG TPA: SLBB domain-containing protein [Sphingomonas sp.]|jgi:protein involved in polysaccharide export with SLBB domain|uniref:SLBB domain-containing protein n=1 Tax=Sphingomonas sp. TaxID=28214 RepID=UPI002ED9C982